MLEVLSHGAPGARPPLLIAHGLFGSGRNWGVIARRLATDRQVLTPDMRNHGASPWHAAHGYPEMAEDLAAVIDAHGGQADVLGHSMGGKAAMVLALTRPEAVARLVVADIAPVAYSHSQQQFIDAMRAVDLSRIERRGDAAEQLAAHVPDRTLQSFFTQSLDVAGRRWRLNLDTLEAEMPKILGFPPVEGVFDGPTLFVAGGKSDYVLPEHRTAIRKLFPRARFVKLPKAGHWLHAEEPRAFGDTVAAFLDSTMEHDVDRGAD